MVVMNGGTGTAPVNGTAGPGTATSNGTAPPAPRPVRPFMELITVSSASEAPPSPSLRPPEERLDSDPWQPGSWTARWDIDEAVPSVESRPHRTFGPMGEGSAIAAVAGVVAAMHRNELAQARRESSVTAAERESRLDDRSFDVADESFDVDDPCVPPMAPPREMLPAGLGSMTGPVSATAGFSSSSATGPGSGGTGCTRADARSESRAPVEDEGDWSGRVAAERPEGPLLDRLPPSDVLPRGGAQGTGTRGAPRQLSCPDGMNGLPTARWQLNVAMQALEVCETQLRRASDSEQQAQTMSHDFKALLAEATEARSEADGLRRDLQRRRGLPRELTLLSTNDLHVLQQELSEALRNVHAELENRTKCCICKTQDREVVLQPCMHLVLCRGCALRVTTCPLCRRHIETHASVRVA
mmetsp:Transcript_129718/g.225367  ORF Transcript_129718/g.225367 Transcript_129718/m.225367 type:complete len:414 (-) Transcript_129718:55-1296(-)